MPKIKVIPKIKFKNLNLDNIKQELKIRMDQLKEEAVVKTRAQREKKIKTINLLWEEYDNGFPIETRIGATFTLVNDNCSDR